MDKQDRRKSFTRPRLSSISELHPIDQVHNQDPIIIKSKCKLCNVDNEHILKYFICKSCKAVNF